MGKGLTSLAAEHVVAPVVKKGIEVATPHVKKALNVFTNTKKSAQEIGDSIISNGTKSINDLNVIETTVGNTTGVDLLPAVRHQMNNLGVSPEKLSPEMLELMNDRAMRNVDVIMDEDTLKNITPSVRSDLNMLGDFKPGDIKHQIKVLQELQAKANWIPKKVKGKVQIGGGKPKVRGDAHSSASSNIGKQVDTDLPLYAYDRQGKLLAGVPTELGRPDANILELHHEIMKGLSSTYIPKAIELVLNGKGTWADIINLNEIARMRGYKFGDYGTVAVDRVPHSWAHNELIHVRDVQPQQGAQMNLWKTDINNLPSMEALTDDFIGYLDDVADPMRDLMTKSQYAWDRIPFKERERLLDYWNLAEEIKLAKKSLTDKLEIEELDKLFSESKEKWANLKKQLLEEVDKTVKKEEALDQKELELRIRKKELSDAELYDKLTSQDFDKLPPDQKMNELDRIYHDRFKYGE